jgi:hypothetical protein
VPTSSRQKTKAKPAAKKAVPPRRAPAPAKKPAAKKPVKPAAKPAPKSAAKPPAAPAIKAEELEVPSPDGRRHVLSLSFVRDGDEFLARLETDAGHITELKNRSLDQLLTLVASELEDLLE